MKLIKIKILTIISGLLTLNGLAMLFSGVVIQMSETRDFSEVHSALNSAFYTNALIFAGLMIMIGFGLLFFNSWARLKNKHSKLVKFA